MVRRFQLLFLYVSLMFCVLFAGVFVEVEAFEIVGAEGEVRVWPSTVDWITGTEPVNKKFNVTVDVIDLYDSVGASISLSWNGSLLDLTDVVFGTLWDWDNAFVWKAYGWIDNVDGELGDCAIIQLEQKPMNKTVWETMVTLEFLYVGPTLDPVNVPSVSTDIVFVHDLSAKPLMPTYWAKWNASAGKSDFYSFAKNYTSTFTYTWKGETPESPTAYFDIVTPTPIYECTTVEFNASGSTGGHDGNTPTVITEYRWNFGDETGWFNYTGVGNSTAFHNYTTAGHYNVTLEVYAPGIGWANASYVPIDTYEYTCLDVRQKLTFEVTVADQTFNVTIDTNSSISYFALNQTYPPSIGFKVTGPGGSVGFCNITIPKNLLSGEPWTILLDGHPVLPQYYEITEDDNFTYVYIRYSLSVREIRIVGTHLVPEFPAEIVMLVLFMVVTLVATAFKKKPRSST